MKPSVLNFSIFCLMLSIPFSYLSFAGVRFLPVLISPLIFFVVLNSKFIVKDIGFIIFIILNFYVFLLGLYVFNFQSTFSILLFLFIAYWPFFLNLDNLLKLDINFILKLYVYFSIFCGVGLLFQVFIYTYFGVVLGTIGEYANRIGFAFIWNDFSFLSLYLASTIPLVFLLKNNILTKTLLVFILFVSSILTTARTGVYSVLIFLILIIFLSLFKFIFLQKKIHKSIFITIPFIVFSIVFILLNVEIESDSRFLSLDSSGRLEDYLLAFDFIYNNILFGSYNDISIYRDSVSIIPHNLFIYNLAVGGLFYFILFILWFLYVFYCVLLCRNKYLVSSIFICLIGFQFIPAVYTAYFFALLLSFCFCFNRIKFSSVIK